MPTKDIAEKVKSIIGREMMMDQEDVKDDSTFTDLGFDSIDVVELVMSLEETFHIQISDAEGELLMSVSDVVKLVQKKEVRQ